MLPKNVSACSCAFCLITGWGDHEHLLSRYPCTSAEFPIRCIFLFLNKNLSLSSFLSLHIHMRKPSSLWPWVSILPSFVPRVRREYGQQFNMVPMFLQHEDLKLLDCVRVRKYYSWSVWLLLELMLCYVIFAYDLNVVFPLTNHRLGLEEEINILYIQFTL